MTVQLKRHQPVKVVTPRDIVRVQDNTAFALSQLQENVLQFITEEPKTSSSPGTRGQVWFGKQSGELKICIATNLWVRFVGVTFP